MNFQPTFAVKEILKIFFTNFFIKKIRCLTSEDRDAPGQDLDFRNPAD
jgi:hypothetical protein